MTVRLPGIPVSFLRTVGAFAAAMSVVVLAACSGAPAAEEAAPAPAPTAAVEPAPANDNDEASTLDGVYTVAQAQRGLGVFDDVCSECHEAVDWQDEGFLERWDNESVYRFWYYIYERMPHGDPFTLSREQVTDVLTYILQLNGLPPGDQELGTDDDSIDDYWLIWSRE